MILRAVLIIMFFSDLINGLPKENNQCSTFGAYFNYKTSPNCRYNEDLEMSTPDMIKKYVPDMETHKVQTSDGYILSVFRMPSQSAPNKGTILLQHALLMDSTLWLLHGNDSLAMRLWHLGYDVWLGNNRGTEFSQEHVRLNTSNWHYWNFSYHEIGLYDVSAQLRFIKSKTNSKIIVIGHSMGSTASLIYAALKPEEAKETIKACILAGASVYYEKSTSIAIPLSKNPRIMQFVTELTNQLGSTMSALQFLRPLVRILAKSFPVVLRGLDIFLSLAGGWGLEDTNPEILNFESPKLVKDFSLKTPLHYMQCMNTKSRFQMFDYGTEGNLKMYQSKVPPVYPVKNINIPIVLIDSVGDSLNALEDSRQFLKELPKSTQVYGHVVLNNVNHFGYHVGKNSREHFINELFNVIRKIN